MMDSRVSSAYVSAMVARIAILLALLAIAVVTTVAPAHAARMSLESGSAHATPAGERMHFSDGAPLACEDERHCGSADAGMCAFVCAGLSTCLLSPLGETGRAYGPVNHDVPPEASHLGRAPGLNDRPPTLRLL